MNVHRITKTTDCGIVFANSYFATYFEHALKEIGIETKVTEQGGKLVISVKAPQRNTAYEVYETCLKTWERDSKEWIKSEYDKMFPPSKLEE